MSNTLVVLNNNRKVAPLAYNNEIVITTKMLAGAYETGETNIKTNFNRNKTRFIEGKHYYKLEGEELKNFASKFSHLQISPKARALIIWTKEGSLQHFNTLTNKKGLNEIKDYFHIDEENIFILSSRKEIEFINQLEEALEPFDIKGIRQFSILSYRIDYYIPSLKVAIEYDENTHKNYSYEAHEGRQQEIEKKLGCRFIRISDKNTNSYNIGFVIKNIFNI